MKGKIAVYDLVLINDLIWFSQKVKLYVVMDLRDMYISFLLKFISTQTVKSFGIHVSV